MLLYCLFEMKKNTKVISSILYRICVFVLLILKALIGCMDNVYFYYTVYL